MIGIAVGSVLGTGQASVGATLAGLGRGGAAAAEGKSRSFADLLSGRPAGDDADSTADQGLVEDPGTPAEALDAATARLQAIAKGEGGDDSVGAVLSDLKLALDEAAPGDPAQDAAAGQSFLDTLSDVTGDTDDTGDDSALMDEIAALIGGMVQGQPLAQVAQALLGLSQAPGLTAADDATADPTTGDATGATATTTATATTGSAGTASGASAMPAPHGTQPAGGPADRAGFEVLIAQGDAAQAADPADAGQPHEGIDAAAADLPAPQASLPAGATPAQTQPAAASTTAATAQPEPTRAQQRLASTVAEQIRSVELDPGQTRIELKPHGLGQIEIDIAQGSDGSLKVTVRAENPMVLDALRADRVAMSQMMQDRGFSMQGGGPDFEQFGGNRQGRDRSAAAGAGTDAIGDISETEAEAAPRRVTGDGLLDLLT
ncbi:flagellar hook-length control protein FliK [Frigidibacter sp. MR17.14]|uniref:flagellar hook-length control protein FliK n=1 Tax=Frigidibacter sp. MR17.14 TaxID=3126509 RepID=UPI003012BCDC